MAVNRSIRALFPAPLKTIASLALLFSTVLLLAPAAGAEVAVLKAASGEVYRMPRGLEKWETAVRGGPVGVGDTVRTGPSGRALIEFADGSTVSLGNDSTLAVTRFLLKPRKRKAVFSLSAGKLRAVVKGFSGRTDMEVRTPTSVSGVKGTDFIVMNQGRANVVFGESETVRVTGRGDGGVMVGPGTMTENTGGADPIEPVEVTPGSLLEEVRAGLEAVTDVHAPVVWEEAGRLPEILARWNINYGHFLADSRSFSKALDVLLIAIDLTERQATKAEARIERGTLYSRNLDEPKKALKEYGFVIEDHPVEPFLENAVFSTGMIYMDLGKKRQAAEFFNRYLEDYPGGAHAGTIELLLRQLEKD